jgi:16S rRNA (uracil1498-N3)-methyltransferase
MHRCFVTDLSQACVTGLVLERDESHHLRNVLRVRCGDKIELFDGKGSTAVGLVGRITNHTIVFEELSEVSKHCRPLCALTLFVCVCKGARMEWLIEKAVELSVVRIVPVVSARTIVRLPTDGKEINKCSRWQHIATEALRQCGGVWMPVIDPPSDIKKAAGEIQNISPTFVAALSPSAIALRKVLNTYEHGSIKKAGWFVGPEGDFTPEELELLAGAGAIPVSLGKNILRAETAAIYGLAILNNMFL